MSEPSALHDPVKIGIVSISDRASSPPEAPPEEQDHD